MWQLLATLSCLLVLTSARSNLHFPPLSDELVNFVNKQNTTWKVGWGPLLCILTPEGGAAAMAHGLVYPEQLI